MQFVDVSRVIWAEFNAHSSVLIIRPIRCRQTGQFHVSDSHFAEGLVRLKWCRPTWNISISFLQVCDAFVDFSVEKFQKEHTLLLQSQKQHNFRWTNTFWFKLFCALAITAAYLIKLVPYPTKTQKHSGNSNVIKERRLTKVWWNEKNKQQRTKNDVDKWGRSICTRHARWSKNSCDVLC